MKRTPLSLSDFLFPNEFRSLFSDCAVFDSSCSDAAKVYYLEKDGGYFLKCAPSGSLEKESRMTKYFHSLGLGAEVLSYVKDEKDWLLTKKLSGEDCTFPLYLDNPKQLCDTLATLLRALHETEDKNCPVKNRTAEYLDSAEKGFREGKFDGSLFLPSIRFQNASEAWREVERNGKYLNADTLLHGDYCLPNVILDDFRFSGFIDLGCGGIGDRHVDLFWGVWTLGFNLKTDAFADRFLDAYGRDLVNEDALGVIAAAEVFG